MNYRLRKVWSRMKRRCLNPNDPGYQWYGSRGITICDEWMESSEPFIKWAVHNGWSPELEIDRRDNDRGYSPENCRWVNKSINAQNRRKRKGAVSKYIGVSKVGDHWQAFIQRDGKRRRLAWTVSEIEAARAYDTAALEIYGPDARVNFPQGVTA